MQSTLNQKQLLGSSSIQFSSASEPITLGVTQQLKKIQLKDTFLPTHKLGFKCVKEKLYQYSLKKVNKQAVPRLAPKKNLSTILRKQVCLIHT